MPSHPDRVRANYHTIEARPYKNPAALVWHLTISVTRIQLASWLGRREASREIHRLVDQGLEQYLR